MATALPARVWLVVSTPDTWPTLRAVECPLAEAAELAREITDRGTYGRDSITGRPWTASAYVATERPDRAAVQRSGRWVAPDSDDSDSSGTSNKSRVPGVPRGDDKTLIQVAGRWVVRTPRKVHVAPRVWRGERSGTRWDRLAARHDPTGRHFDEWRAIQARKVTWDFTRQPVDFGKGGE